MTTPEPRVWVTEHALTYLDGPRTGLLYREVVNLLKARAYVDLGTAEDGATFVLVWDRHNAAGTILVTRPGQLENEIKVVSVWQTDFTLPNRVRTPTDDDLVTVSRLSEGIPDTYIRPLAQT